MIAKSKKTSLIIKVDVLAEHTFSGIVIIDDNFYTAGNYSEKWRLDCFDIENETKPIVAPNYYDNTNGSLYLFAEQHKLNAWEFDIIKRIVRCRKKGNFIEDLHKTIEVIKLYENENGTGRSTT